METKIPTLAEATAPSAVLSQQEAPTEQAEPTHEAPSLETSPEKPESTEKVTLADLTDGELTHDSKEKKGSEEPPAEESKFDQGREEKGAQYIKRLKGEIANRDNELKQLRQQVEEVKKSPKTDPTEVQSLRDQLNSLTEQLEIASLERSPRFKERYDNAKAEAVGEAEAIAKDNAIDAVVLKRAMALSGEDRKAFLRESIDDPATLAELSLTLRKIDNVEAQRAAALANHKESLKQFADDSEQKGTQELLQQFDAMAPAMQQRLSVLREIEGDEAHNSTVRENLALARALMSGEADPSDIMAAPYLAVAAKQYIAMNRDLKAQNEKLQDRISEYEKSVPVVKGRGSDSEKASGGRIPSLKEAASDFSGL